MWAADELRVGLLHDEHRTLRAAQRAVLGPHEVDGRLVEEGGLGVIRPARRRSNSIACPRGSSGASSASCGARLAQLGAHACLARTLHQHRVRPVVAVLQHVSAVAAMLASMSAMGGST